MIKKSYLDTTAADEELRKEWPVAVKVISAVLIAAGFVYILTECVRAGLWFVTLGVAALAICAAFGVLIIWLSNKMGRQKSFEITIEKTDRL